MSKRLLLRRVNSQFFIPMNIGFRISLKRMFRDMRNGGERQELIQAGKA
jgi:hypothetical protein